MLSDGSKLVGLAEPLPSCTTSLGRIQVASLATFGLVVNTVQEAAFCLDTPSSGLAFGIMISVIRRTDPTLEVLADQIYTPLVSAFRVATGLREDEDIAGAFDFCADVWNLNQQDSAFVLVALPYVITAWAKSGTERLSPSHFLPLSSS